MWTPIRDESPIDLSHLTPKARKIVKTRGDLSRVEAENVLTVISKYLAVKPRKGQATFDVSWCLKVHEEMFREVWTWAGIPRTEDINIGVPFYNIQSDMKNLCDDLSSWSGYNMEIAEQATRLHHRAVQIHPFPNGNGRWARMLANIWLICNDLPLVMWPATIGKVSEIRDEYILAIKEADDGNYEPLLAMHERHTDRDDRE